MSEKQKQILEKVAQAVPNMTDFEKGYLTALVEIRSGKKSRRDRKKEAEVCDTV